MAAKPWWSVGLAFALAGCAALGGSSSAAVPTLVLSTPAASLAPAGGGVTASGILVAAQEADLAFTIGGQVVSIPVTLGQQVQAGQLLAQLDPTAAQQELDQAQRNLVELTSPEAIANAQLALGNAEKALSDAQLNYDNVVANYPKGGLLEAQDSLAKASAHYHYVLNHHDPGTSGMVEIRTAYTYYVHALQDEQKAEADYASNQPSGVGASQSTVDIITGQYELAKANLSEAQNYLTALRGQPVPDGATGAQLAALANARGEVAAAQHQLAAARLTAPFSGIVSTVNAVVGDYAAPGQVLISLVDVSHLHVETTDLSERSVPQVKAGETVTVLLEDLNQNVTGRVRSISPTAGTLGGDVVYKVIIDLDSQPDGVRAGMSVKVSFGPGS